MSHPPPPPPSGHKCTQAGVAPGSAGRGVTWSCGLPRRGPGAAPLDTLSLILLQPPQPVQPPPPSGKLQEQPRCSHVFSSQVLSPLCSPPSDDVLCNQLERQPSWSQGAKKVLGKTEPSFPTPSSSLPPSPTGSQESPTAQTKGRRTDGWFPLCPPARKCSTPLPSRGLVTKGVAEDSLKGSPSRLFSRSLLHCTFPPGPLGSTGWVGTVSLSTLQGFGNLTASEFAGTERNLADLSPSLPPTHTKLVEIQERVLPKDTGILISVQRREASSPTSSEDLIQEEDGSKPSVRAGEPSQPSTPQHSFKAGPCQSARDPSHTGGEKE